MMPIPGFMHWIALSTILFGIGIYGVLSRKSALGVLIAIELMLNSAAMNFIIFDRYITPGLLDGALMVIFIITVAAAEAVVAMAIFVAIYRNQKTVDVTKMNAMKG